MPAAELVKGLPGAKTGTIRATLWAELGDAQGRWEPFRHLQAEAGVVPLTKASGKSRVVEFRFSCNKILRQAAYWLAFVSLKQSEWANHYYRDQRAKGHSHPQALRALGAKWLKIIFVMWRDHTAVRRVKVKPVIKKILVPTSFSPMDKVALEWALDLAKKTSAAVILLHVIDPIKVKPDTTLKEAAELMLLLANGRTSGR
jgi:hypothetical protein